MSESNEKIEVLKKLVREAQEAQKSATFGDPKWEAASRKIHILAECIVSEEQAAKRKAEGK